MREGVEGAPGCLHSFVLLGRLRCILRVLRVAAVLRTHRSVSSVI